MSHIIKYTAIIVGLVYGMVASHYVAKGIRTKLESVGLQVIRELFCEQSVLV